MEFASKGVIHRNDAMACIGRYLHFVPKPVKKEIFREMQKAHLIEKASVKMPFHNNGDFYRIVSPEKDKVSILCPKDGWSWSEKW